jgi:alanine racemase
MTAGEVLPEALELRPIVAWKSRIVQVKTIESGTPVGYGSKWRAKRKTILGLVPVGYADGYPTSLGLRDDRERTSGGTVAVFDRAPASSGHEHGGLLGYAPVVGAINMDQISIDLTDVLARRSGATNTASEMTGAIVEIISPDPKAPNHLPTLASLAGIIPHELLTGLSQRITRQYVAPVNAVEHVAHAQFPNRRETASV